jgi:hypothetical protein
MFLWRSASLVPWHPELGVWPTARPSDEPLIGAADSVRPIPAGTYTIGDSKDAFTDDLTVTHVGTITRIAEGEDDTSDLWIRGFDRGYYVAMWHDGDGEYSYALLSIEAAGFTVYQPSYHCDRHGSCGSTPERRQRSGDSFDRRRDRLDLQTAPLRRPRARCAR